jgi:hypothetical protein
MVRSNPSESFREDNKAEGKSFIHKQPVEDARWENHLKVLGLA